MQGQTILPLLLSHSAKALYQTPPNLSTEYRGGCGDAGDAGDALGTLGAAQTRDFLQKIE